MIVIQFDRGHFHRASLLVRSLAFHDPEHRIFADTVDLDNPQIAQLRNRHPGLETEVQTSPEGPGLSATMANRKAKVLRDAMKLFPNEPVFGLFGVDLLMRRPLADMWARLEGQPTSLFVTNGQWRDRFQQHLQIVSGIGFVRRDGARLAESGLG